MKRVMVVLSVLALVLMAGTAIAADSATVAVTATVDGSCEFELAGTTLPFGTLLFDGAGAAIGGTASGSIRFRCTTGALYQITDDDGLNETGLDAPRLASTTLAVTEYIPYTFTYAPTSGTGAGWATWETLALSGDIAANSYTANSPDAYADTVTLYINP